MWYLGIGDHRREKMSKKDLVEKIKNERSLVEFFKLKEEILKFLEKKEGKEYEK